MLTRPVQPLLGGGSSVSQASFSMESHEESFLSLAGVVHERAERLSSFSESSSSTEDGEDRRDSDGAKVEIGGQEQEERREVLSSFFTLSGSA